jgi:hypothetical protein
MLAPREWRLETTDEFDGDRAAVEVGAPRFDAHMRLWTFWLERRPFQFTHGLTEPDDDLRVLVSNEPLEGVQYVVGVQVDRRRHLVTLRWLDVAEGLD